MGDVQKFMRGQIWWLPRYDNKTMNAIQNDGRPVVIISNNTGNKFSPALMIAPLTTADKKALPTHVKITMEDGQISTVLCEQIKTINNNTLAEFVGNISETKMTEINGAICVALGLKEIAIKNEPSEPVAVTYKPEPAEIETYSPPVITLNPEPTVTINEEVTDTDVGESTTKLRAKKFTKQERKMIERYLNNHTITETAKYFAEIYNTEYQKMYARVSNVYYRARKK